MIVVLDTFPTTSVAKLPRRARQSLSDICHQWVLDCELRGHRVLVPAISYYEALRELERRNAVSQIVRLKAFCLEPKRFIPVTTEHLETAAKLWAQSRRVGLPTADRHALDADAILAAQALSLNVPAPNLVVATTNAAHLSRYVPADLWTNISI